MIQKLIFLFSFLLVLTGLQGQTPGNISVQGNLATVATRSPDMCNEAGTITRGQHTGQSNDVTGEIIFLCEGDSMQIIHNGDFDLSGDPNPSTPPGISYGFYDCRPAEGFAGPDLATVNQDTCLNKTSPIFLNGVPTPQRFGMWLTFNEINGNMLLFNQQQLQDIFNGGAPVQFWFAPVTVDNFAALGFENDGAGGPTGPCVDVSPQEAFSVVYLNAVEVSSVNTGIGPNGCTGSFVVDGGLPEFDPSAEYSISIVKEDDPSVLATITRNPLPDPGETVEFFVSEPGNYLITVEDGKSCGGSAVANMTACEAVTLNLTLRNARPGENICLPVTVENFNGIAGFQGSIAWDPDVLRFTEVRNFNPDLANSEETFDPSLGTLAFTWFDAVTPGTLDDGAILFEVCFEVVGVFGQSSPVRFSNEPTFIEISNDNGPVGSELNDGRVNISNDLLFVGLTPDSVSCSGERDGSITIQVAQGTTPYSVTWDSIPSSGPFKGPIVIPDEGGMATIPNLPAGLYEIRVADSSNPPVTYTDTVIVAQPLALGARIRDIQPSCFGESDGSVGVEVTVGGIIQSDLTGYSFRWNVTNENVPRLDSVASGLYAVTVTDPGGCTAMASTTLSQPAPIVLDATITDASCSGATNGGITVSASGGNTNTGNYIFTWDSLGSSTGSTATVTNLAPGEYSLTVTDEIGCSNTEIFDVRADKTLIINEVLTNIACFNGEDGEIFLTGSTSGAAPVLPYTFSWSGPGIPGGDSETGTESRRTGLRAGIYSVTMADADPAGCEIVEEYELTHPDSIMITLFDKTDETCTIGNDGSAIIEVEGGVYPYSYLWYDRDRDTVALDSIALNLSSGPHSAIITDENGCIDSLEVFINAPTPPFIDPIQDDMVRCFGDTDGSLTVSARPGNAPITGYQWSNNATGTSISGLSPGVYYVTVSAADGCASLDSAFVISPAPMAIDSILAAAPTCAGDSDGSLTVFASGGTTPYKFVWSNQEPGDTIGFNLWPALRAGSYQVTVVDGNYCEEITGTGTVSDPPAITVSLIDTVAVSCFNGACDGQATAIANYSDGSTGSFNFTWASGELTSGAAQSSAIQLCGGIQAITVTDADQCFIVDTINIPSPPAIDIVPMINPVTCNGSADGSVTLAVSGGTPGYEIRWVESGDISDTQVDLDAGLYNAIITDANGCNKSQRIEIAEPARLILSIDPVQTQDPSCNATTDGVLAVMYNAADGVNPVGPSPYTWSDGIAPSSSSIASDLSAGTYSVTITDTKGCRDSLTYLLTEPPPVVAIIPDPLDPRCFGEATLIFVDTAFGGNGSDIFDYMYQVDNNGISFTIDQPASVFAGEHIITVEDQEGCTFVDTVQINQPGQLTVAFEPDLVVVELGDSTTRLDPIITSSLPIDSFIWTPTDYLVPPNVQRPILNNPLNSNQYNLTVIDANGCQGSGSVFVEVDKNRNVYIPNVFSPNGDGPNDEFRLFACKGVETIVSAHIFDRWGELVHEADEIFPNCDGGTVIWNGLKGGQEMPSGVYVYMIKVKFIDNTFLLYRGDISLLK